MAIAHDLLAFMYQSYCVESVRLPVPQASDQRVRRRREGNRTLSFQYFIGRLFHAAPHPGNVFVHPVSGASLIDWGMVCRLDRPTSLKLALTLVDIVENDGDGAAKAWVEMGKPTPWADISGFTGDMAALVPRASTASLEELDFGITLTTVLRHSTKRGIKISPVIPVLGKSFANIEGSIRFLAPELSAAGVLRTELPDIMVDLTCETLSESYLARSVIELLLTTAGSYNHARGILRDVSNGELPIPVDDTRATHKTLPTSSKVLYGTLAAVAGTSLWRAGRPPTGW